MRYRVSIKIVCVEKEVIEFFETYEDDEGRKLYWRSYNAKQFAAKFTYRSGKRNIHEQDRICGPLMKHLGVKTTGMRYWYEGFHKKEIRKSKISLSFHTKYILFE